MWYTSTLFLSAPPVAAVWAKIFFFSVELLTCSWRDSAHNNSLDSNVSVTVTMTKCTSCVSLLGTVGIEIDAGP